MASDRSSIPKHRLLFPFAAALAASTAASAADLSFTPASLAFPSTALAESRLLTSTLKNNTALGVNLTGVVLGGTNAADYSQTNNCPQPLPAGKSCVFSVTFKPASLKASSASLTVATDDPAMPSVVLPLSGNLYPAVLNDTGITQCGNLTQNGLPCPVAGFPRQDAEYGRDKLHNTNADGHAGFSFTKLDANGKALPASATAWNCVRDNVTGLVWEKKPKGDGKIGNQGLHDADDTYTWYSTDSTNNAGSVGYPNQGDRCYGYNAAKAATYCNTEAFVKRVNVAGWCGAKDWRMPNRVELRGLVDLSISAPGPTIDMGYFPDTVNTVYPPYRGNIYWSSSPSATYVGGSGFVGGAWFVSFYEGLSYDFGPRDNSVSVRLVRGGQ